MKTVIGLTMLALASAATIAVAAPEGGHRGGMMERLKAADTNGDGLISRAEAAALPRLAERFEQIDANRDGQVSFEELRAARGHGKHGHGHGGMMKHLDADGDGKVSKAEALTAAEKRFDRADADQDGFITREEAQAARKAHRQHAAK